MNEVRLKDIPEQLSGSKAAGTFLVLSSGGIDSSSLLWLAAEQGLSPSALFVDYGQPAAQAERAAVDLVCSALGAPVRYVRYSGTCVVSGEIPGRNAFLLHTALIEFSAESGVVALGIHGGTGYVDCSPAFLELMQRSYDYHTGGKIAVVAPFLHWTKLQVYMLATRINLPLANTYSCESACRPCGHCRSCLDRTTLDRGLAT